ncbi:MAG: extracellular solute-binding protein [Actinobacteria bacterium]|nr:extracellular solute-binding protein [Actinomycetota bacterium]MBL7123432.1 extracellular solute-binding protein [Actinomycetota bacterium]
MKKSSIILLVGIFVVSMLAMGIGCQEAAEAPAEEEAAVEEEAKGFEGQTIVVKLSPDIAMSGLKGVTEQFEKEYGVTVDYNEIGWDVWFPQQSQILATDEPLDVMGNGKNAWIEFPDKLTDLTNTFPDMFSEMVPELVEYSTLQGKVMAVPFLPSYQIMFYNKTIFEDAGAEIPETWDEFKTTLKNLNDYNGSYNYVADWTTENFFLNFILTMQSSGVPEYNWVDGDLVFNFDAPETVMAVEFMKSLLDEDLIDPGILVQIQQEVSSLFDQGDIAMMAMWEMYAGFLTEEQYENTGYFAFPGREKGMTGTLDGHEYLMIPKSAENPELAAEYIKYVATYENTKTRAIVDKCIAVYTDQFSDPEVIDGLPFLPVIELVKGNLADQFPPIKSTYELRLECATQIHPALLGEVSAEEACAGLQEFADAQEAVEQ